MWITYKSLQVIVKVAGLSMCVEQMQSVLALNHNLRIEHSLVRQGVTHHSIGVGIEFSFHDGESWHYQKAAICGVAWEEAWDIAYCMIDQASFLSVANQPLFPRVEGRENLLEADYIKVI